MHSSKWFGQLGRNWKMGDKRLMMGTWGGPQRVKMFILHIRNGNCLLHKFRKNNGKNLPFFHSQNKFIWLPCMSHRAKITGWTLRSCTESTCCCVHCDRAGEGCRETDPLVHDSWDWYIQFGKWVSWASQQSHPEIPVPVVTSYHERDTEHQVHTQNGSDLSHLCHWPPQYLTQRGESHDDNAGCYPST